MIIDTESPEGRAVVALARFGRAALNGIQDLSTLWLCAPAVKHGLMTDRDWRETDLAKLPEGL